MNVANHMTDRPPLNEWEMKARHDLVKLAHAMLADELPFIEGAVQVLGLRQQVGGIADRDEDFAAFVLIMSETDHLPLQAQRALWAPTALERLTPELEHTQDWAGTFARDACARLIARFGP